jgi:hypothetical protein
VSEPLMLSVSPPLPRITRAPHHGGSRRDRDQRATGHWKVLIRRGSSERTRIRSERAYKPDSVFAPERHRGPRAATPTQTRRRSFLWAADRSTAQCGLPEGLARTPKRPAHVTGRAGPPLLFGLAPRGVYRAADIAARAVGSYPTVSPLPSGAL